MDIVKVVVKSIIKEGCIEDYKKVVFELIEETRKENGLISYELYQDNENPNIMAIIEKWESQQALDVHAQTQHYKRLVPQLAELKVEGDINFYSLIK